MTSTLHAYNEAGAEVYTSVRGQPIRLRVETDVPSATFEWGNVPGLTVPSQANPEHERIWDNLGLAPGQHTLVVDVSGGRPRGRVEEARLRYYVAEVPEAAIVQGLHSSLGQQLGRAITTAQAETAREMGSALQAASKDTTQRFVDAFGPVVGAIGEVRDALVDSTTVSLRRSAAIPSSDIGLWIRIRKSARGLSFNAYKRVMDLVLCNVGPPDANDDDSVDLMDLEGRVAHRDTFRRLALRRALPFNDTEAYRFLKVATEAFVITRTQVPLEASFNRFTPADVADAARRLSVGKEAIDIEELKQYLVQPEGTPIKTIPYLALVRKTLSDQGIKKDYFVAASEDRFGVGFPEECYGILEEKLASPLLLELLWSYWQEEGMQVQTMNAISRRFQNIRGPGERDPLANFETDPLRPLNNLLWGYIQDEQHRLNIVRRAYEYDHHYGMSLYGQAVPRLRPADSRSRFLEAFHNLLYRCKLFFAQDDDTTVISDGFPLLSALQEVHLILSQGAHNQFGDLPSTARQEMLIEQWILARPELREFLPTRVMVDYPEQWMHRVDSMKTLQAWSDVSVLQFHNLARYGEQIVLSIRYGQWNDPNILPDQARNWARYWRAEIQGYIHAYRATTGVDLNAEVTDTRAARDRALQPSVLLRRQLDQRQRGLANERGRTAPMALRGAPAPTLGPPNGVVVHGARMPTRP